MLKVSQISLDNAIVRKYYTQVTAHELIKALIHVPSDARVWMGYDGDIVVTSAAAVEHIESEKQIGDCWYRVQVGDVVILSEEQ